MIAAVAKRKFIELIEEDKYSQRLILIISIFEHNLQLDLVTYNITISNISTLIVHIIVPYVKASGARKDLLRMQCG